MAGEGLDNGTIYLMGSGNRIPYCRVEATMRGRAGRGVSIIPLEAAKGQNLNFTDTGARQLEKLIRQARES